jgi:hypothetical protein
MKEPFPVGTKLMSPDGSCVYVILAYSDINYPVVKVCYLDDDGEATWSVVDILEDIPLTPLLEALL